MMGWFARRGTRLRLSHVVFASIVVALVAGIIVALGGPYHSRIADFRTLNELRVATRVDTLAYRGDEDGAYGGFEHDLLIALGERLGVPVQFIPYPDSTHALEAVINGQAHLAAAGLSRNSRLPLAWTAGLRETDFILVGRSNRRAFLHERNLAGRIVTVRPGTKLAEAVEALRKRVPKLEIVYSAQDSDEQDLLMQAAEGRIDLLATENTHYALAHRFAPKLAIVYDLPLKSTVSWALPPQGDGGLAAEINDFLDEANTSGLLARIEDRYFGHVRRLDRYDIAVFLDRIKSRLPRYISHFREAEARTGIDWRYLAAISYQESHWNPEATSYTGVRGIMMLTVDTANRLGVENRLDPKQAISGGARYLAMLQARIPDKVPYPDRMWMTSAAYNIGPGGLDNARAITRQLGKNDTSWVDVKSALPLLTPPKYANQFKTGPVRGGEALIMAENIRNFYDILRRSYPSEAPMLVEARPAVRSATGLQVDDAQSKPGIAWPRALPRRDRAHASAQIKTES